MLKKIAASILAISMLGAMTTTVFAAQGEYNPEMTYTYENDASVSLLAAEDGYISTLKMSANSNHVGAVRDYAKSSFSCTINNATGMSFNVDANMSMVAKVVEKNLFGVTELSRGSCTFTANNQTETISIGECGKGKRAFSFFTPKTSGITSESVELISE